MHGSKKNQIKIYLISLLVFLPVLHFTKNNISLWTAVHVVAKRARERAKTTTIYSRRIENLQLWSDHNDLFGRKSGESVKVKIWTIGAAGYDGDKSPKLFG